MIKKNSHGGARKGARRPYKYGEPSERITINVPISKKENILEKIKLILKKYEMRSKQIK